MIQPSAFDRLLAYRKPLFPLFLLLSFPFLSNSSAQTEIEAEPNPLQPHLVSEYRSVSPGSTHYLGLWLEHPIGYHSYWKGPGIVGVPTELSWNLPEGWTAGDIIWPPPQRVKMFDIDAHGYRGEAMLVIPISIPKKVDLEEVILKVKATWMCCSKTCHPGFEDLSITLKIDQDAENRLPSHWFDLIHQTIDSTPTPIDTEWKMDATSKGETITLTASPPQVAKSEEIYFFDERGTVDSDRDQKLANLPDGSFTLEMIRSEFGPKDDSLKGLLWRKGGWIDEREFLPIELSIIPRSTDEASGNK